MTTVCTLNWELMMDFYCRVLGMEADNCNFKHIVSLKGLNSEVRLQRVHDELEKEVIGRLEFETNEAGFCRFLANRSKNPFEIRSSNTSMELLIRDPDGNSLFVSQEADARAA